MKKYLLLLPVALIMMTGCTPATKAGAGMALPFTGIADVVMVPFTGLGALSKVCIEAGEMHNQEVRAEYSGFQTIEDNEFDQLSPTQMAELTSAVYFIPGWCLYPFDAMTPDELFYCTRHMIAHIEDTHAFTEKPRYVPNPNFKN